MKEFFEGSLAGIGVGMFIVLLIMSCDKLKAQQPEQDTPFVPYQQVDAVVEPEESITHYIQQGPEIVGYKMIPEGSDLDYDLDIKGSHCPFILNMKFDLAFFQAECENVDFSQEQIIIPIGCRFTMQLEGRHKARINHETCPVVLVFQIGHMKGA